MTPNSRLEVLGAPSMSRPRHRPSSAPRRRCARPCPRCRRSSSCWTPRYRPLVTWRRFRSGSIRLLHPGSPSSWKTLLLRTSPLLSLRAASRTCWRLRCQTWQTTSIPARCVGTSFLVCSISEIILLGLIKAVPTIRTLEENLRGGK